MVDTVNDLLVSGAEVDVPDKENGTPLFDAVYNGHAGCASLLIGRKVNLLGADRDGRTALHHAASFGMRECLMLLIDAKANINIGIVRALYAAVYAAYYNLLTADKRGNTPLHLAAFNDNGLMVTYLLDRGADVSVKTVEGITPLHYAAYRGHLANLVALSQKGIQVCNPLWFCRLFLMIVSFLD